MPLRANATYLPCKACTIPSAATRSSVTWQCTSLSNTRPCVPRERAAAPSSPLARCGRFQRPLHASLYYTGLVIVKTRPPLILVHGVNSDGEWYSTVLPFLEIHFQPVRVSYRQYQLFGVQTLARVQWVHVRFLALLVVAIPAGARFTGLQSALMVGSFFALNRIGCAIRRARAVRDARLSLAGTRSQSCSAIAHSFGSVILYDLFAAADDVAQLKDIVFVGSILSRSAQLQRFVGTPALKPQLWNMVASDDWRSLLAPTLVVSQPDVGSAGRWGFKSTPAMPVHTLAKASASCRQCVSQRREYVHNVPLPGREHRLLLRERDLVSCVWLPMLLGLLASEFALFAFCSSQYVKAHRRSDAEAARKALGVLLRGPWDLACDKPLVDYLSDIIRNDRRRGDYDGQELRVIPNAALTHATRFTVMAHSLLSGMHAEATMGDRSPHESGQVLRWLDPTESLQDGAMEALKDATGE